MNMLTFGHADWAGKCITHRNYALKCADFEEIWLRAGGLCAICRITGGATPHGLLHIDHHAEEGRWAVRGLLCSWCNTQLPCMVDQPAVAAYLARPWYRDMLRRRGVRCGIRRQPRVGGWAIAKGHWFRRYPEGWRRELGPVAYGRAPKTRRSLHWHYGPHNIRTADET